ncbi:hypothetical protein ACOMHN_016135 [Nucella lapillus]
MVGITSKDFTRILLTILACLGEKTLAEEQADFTSSTSGFFVRNVCNTNKVYRVFVDFKNAFDSLTCSLMRRYIADINLDRIMTELYHHSPLQWRHMLQKTVGVRQERLLLPTLFGIFLERLGSSWNRTMTNLPDAYGLAG